MTLAADSERPLVTQRRLFIVLGVMACLVILIIRVQSLLAERDQILSQQRAQASTLAQFAATYSARLYDQSKRVALEVSLYIQQQRPSPGELQRYLASRAADTSADDYIVVLDQKGRVLATSQGLEAPQLRFASLPTASWRPGEPEIVPVMRSPLTGAIIYSLSQRLEDDAGGYAGVVGVNVRPEGIRGTAERKPQDPLLSVWRQDGRFVAASFVDFDARGRAIAPAKPPGLPISGSPAASSSAIVASQPVQGWPLVAVASYDVAGVLKAWRRSLYETAVILLLVFAGIGALMVLGVRTADREARARRELLDANAATARALEERDLLLREIHHRVKNSLMMTSGLLNLQARRFRDPEVQEAFEAIKGQLHSVGLVHEALYNGSSLDAVDIRAYLERLLPELANGYGAKARKIVLTLDAEPLLLAPHQTTPLGLIVAEVVTNAFKHAFAPEQGGEIVVRVRLANPDEILLEIRDDGRGYKAGPPSKGTGLGARLLEALSQQLGGSASISNDGGAAFRLTFPRLGSPGAGSAGRRLVAGAPTGGAPAGSTGRGRVAKRSLAAEARD